MKTKSRKHAKIRIGIWILLFSLGVRAESLDSLRQRQKADQKNLLEYYDGKALKDCPKLENGNINKASPEYKKLLNDYKRAHTKLNEIYRKQDPRLTDLKAETPGLKNSGSVPKNVKSDVDWTSESDEVYQNKQQEWEARGDKLEVEGHKVVNKTTDETMWEPGTKAGDDALVRDGDAHGTEGGRQKVAGGDNVRDAEGSALDQKKKYLDAKERGNMKDQAKVATKGADDTGRSNDTIEEARNRKDYGDTVTSETSDLGDSKEARQQKEKEFEKRLDQEVEKNLEEATKKGKQTDEIREKIQEQAKKTDTTKDAEWDKARKDANYDGEKTTDEAIKDRRDRVKESNQKTRDEIARREQELEKSQAGTESKSENNKVDDGPVQKTTETETETRKVEVEDAAGKKSTAPDSDVETSKSKTADAPKVEVDAPKADAPKVEIDAPKADAPKVEVEAPKGKMSKIGDAAGTADDVIDFIDRGTQMAEGIEEGNIEKTIAPVVGQDTAKRVQMENANEWAEEEGKVEEARADEVSTKLEAKLRRKGASKEEAAEAREKFEKGDMKGFRDDVAEIKAKGIEDSKQDGFTPDGPLEEEDGVVERLKEGGKQIIDYVDPGVRARSKESKDNMESLDKQNDALQKNLQTEIEQEIIKKAMRKGVDRQEAEAALAKKRKGDRSDWDELREQMERSEQNDDGSSLSAEDRTQKYEFGDQVDEKGKDAHDFAEEKGKIVLKPVEKILEAQDKAHLDEMSEDEQAAETYKKLRKLGVPPEEAMDAARDFAEDETGNKLRIRDLRDKYRKIQEEEAQAKQAAEETAEAENRKQALKGEEAPDQEEWSEEKDLENKHKALEEFAQRNREQRQKESDQDYEGMEVIKEMEEAQHAGDDDRRQAKTERNQAGEDARDIETESNRIVKEGDRENSWGKTLGDALEDGITTGTKTLGQEFGNAAADQVIDEIWEPEPPPPPPPPPQKTASSSSASSPGGASPSASGMVSSEGQPRANPDKSGDTAAATPVADTTGGDTDSIEGKSKLPKESTAVSTANTPCPYCGVIPATGWATPYKECPRASCVARRLFGPNKNEATEKAAPPEPTPTPVPKKYRDGCGVEGCGAPVTYSHDHYLYGSVYKCTNGHTIKGVDVIQVEVKE